MTTVTKFRQATLEEEVKELTVAELNDLEANWRMSAEQRDCVVQELALRGRWMEGIR